MKKKTKLGYSGWILVMSFLAVMGISFSGATEAIRFGTPTDAEGTRIFKATEHPHYSGQFNIKGAQATLVGRMQDQSPWDHMDYTGKHLSPVSGVIDINVNERTNTGLVVAEFNEGTDHYRIVFDRFAENAPFQDGGIATRVYEHGDSGNGDPVYPKTWLYLAGWGKADLFKNGEILYKDYSAHFMVMERSRDPKTHQVHYPEKRALPGGETDPAGMEVDLWIRSKELNSKNLPPYEVFLHLYWDEVTWR